MILFLNQFTKQEEGNMEAEQHVAMQKQWDIHLREIAFSWNKTQASFCCRQRIN